MFAPYRRVLATPGALAFSTAGLIARLPISMVSISVILLITGHYGEYALAGRVASVYVIAQALCAPQLAKLIDSFGQARIMRPALAISVTGLGGLAVLSSFGAAEFLLYLAAAVAGATIGSIGALVRSRWAGLLSSPKDLHVAFSLESVLDEVVFIVGPMLATFLGTTWSPMAGIIVAIGAAALGGFWFLGQRRTEPPVNRRNPGQTRPPLAWGSLILVSLVHASMGVLFGASDVGTIAFSAEQGHPAMAGALLAIWAFGSLLSGLVYGARHFTSPTLTRFAISAALLAGCACLFVLASNLWMLAATMFLAGFAVAPTFIGGAALVQELVPAERLTESLTWLVTSTGMGFAIGTSLAGSMVDDSGGMAAFYATSSAGVLTALIAGMTWLLLPRSR